MRRTVKAGRGCVWALAGAAGLIALVPWQGIIWDGGFPDIECRLRFVDETGKPLPGVTLKVVTKTGGVCHFYPVDEFVPETAVVSDADGRMTFHHSAKYLEFSGHEYRNFFGMRFGKTRAPRYDCVFMHGEREVFQTPFNFHQREWDQFQQPTITRPRTPWNTTAYGRLPEEDFTSWQLRLFDANRDGILDREEKTAASYFTWRLGEEEFAEKPTGQSFRVVERTVVVTTP
ncbi:MAG: hypothetical protein J0I06_18110 [Planctomycetes bacterium]|nr:hypothetical protein [Planctomycetota bacterium]